MVDYHVWLEQTSNKAKLWWDDEPSQAYGNQINILLHFPWMITICNQEDAYNKKVVAERWTIAAASNRINSVTISNMADY